MVLRLKHPIFHEVILIIKGIFLDVDDGDYYYYYYYYYYVFLILC
jgi:hypothetical protein